MFHGMENEWLGYKSEPIEEVQTVGNIARSWQWREQGINPHGYPPNKVVLQNTAEDILVQKPLQIRCCDLPGSPRSTFLMVFSPDGTKVASTHGNHNVYVSELASGKHVRILKGHPRTPWCIAFHPSHPQLIGSGCLGGQVRVWDIASGGSETWNVRSETVIASIAFHPREQLLVIATYNELYFWDWSQPAPFNKVSTNNFNEKVRYVAFDSLGYKLITGISLWASAAGAASNPVPQQNISAPGPTNNPTNRRDDNDDSGNPPDNQSGSAQDMIVNSYQNLVQRYDSLVRNYQRLFMVRHRLTNTPPPPNMTDRGTDPMETDVSNAQNSGRAIVRPSTSQNDDVNPTPSTSRRPDGSGDSGDGDNSSSRLLNLDVLSIDSNPSRNHEQQAETNTFGSRSSAFQPLGEGRHFRISDNERSTRLLPNPFSTSSVAPRPSRMFSDNQQLENSNASRTSIFTSLRPEIGLTRGFLQSRRNSSPTSRNRNSSVNSSESHPAPSTSQGPQASTSGTNTRRPTMTNSSTQMSPTTTPVDAQTINESLDLIRDILRDSGTRLLNLITNMSISTLASVERHMSRRGARTQSEDSDGRARGPRPRLRLFSPSIRRDLLSSSSDSDSDSLEVNILRTRNSSFREDDVERPTNETSNRLPTDRMEFELNDNDNEDNSESSGINVSMSSSRFRVRTQNSSAAEDSNLSGRDDGEPSGSRMQTAPESNPGDSSEPSTSRDAFFSRVPPDEAYRKVRSGVNILQKHTMQLTNLWLRGNRTTLRELRNMWENLRRRILTLHRETGRQDLPGYYSRTLLERCMILTEMSDNISRTNRRSNPRNESSERNTGENEDVPSTSAANASTSANARTSVNASTTTESEQNNSTETTGESRPRRPLTRSPSIRNPALFRRTLQSNYRWRPEDELRRRSRNPVGNRLGPRYINRPRRDFARAIEISATRHVIRMRAMQVLSIMFNMMMMCLEERGLSQLIINMLRTLKKALALTCLMLMTNRTVVQTGRTNNPTTSSSQRVDSLNVVRIQNIDHSGPVNVDEPEENLTLNTGRTSQRNEREKNSNNNNELESVETVANIGLSFEPQPSTSQATPTVCKPEAPPAPTNKNTQKWSNRLAVQIAAANRNTSITARNRRETYLEARREKALHRTNPSAYPLIRKRGLPPVWTYRIPALRSMPMKARVRRPITPRVAPAEEPIAGPSTPRLDPSNDDNNERSEVLNEFEHRVNLIRLAHMQAVRLRNAARNRFRRLQTIRLYTPSSVREMFALQSNNGESSHGSRSPQQGGTEAGRRILAQIISSRSEGGRGDEEPSHFHTVLNNVAMPLMQVNDMPVNSEPPSQPQRLPRIHEYLQPIILAQNSMAVDDDNGEGGGGPRRMGGMAGLLDPGVISEALPNPSHRVQAWDFTTGKTPDIADSKKNVVVQRCRIHNDASIDISKDGRLLVALLPVPRLRNTNHWLGVYSLEWSRLGQCLHTAVLEQSAVSVALSPTARHLAVGLGSRRFTSTPHARNNVFALLYRLEPLENSSRNGLTPIKELEQHWEHGFTSLNCLRWAPQPGQGLVYANNTGQLVIMS